MLYRRAHFTASGILSRVPRFDVPATPATELSGTYKRISREAVRARTELQLGYI